MRLIALISIAFLSLVAILASGERGGRLLLASGFPSLAASVLQDPAWRGVALYRAGDFTASERLLRQTRSPEAAYNLGNALAQNENFPLAIKAYDIALKRNPDDDDARANRALVLAAQRTAPAGPRGKAKGDANATASRETTSADLATDDAGVESSSGDGMAGQREAGSDSDSAGASRVDRRGDAQAGKTEAGQGSTSKGAATDSAGRAGRGGGQTIAARSDTPPPVPPSTSEATSGQATLQWLAALPDDPVRFLRLRITAEQQRRLSAGTAVRQGGSPW